ncbi:Thioredoxin [hydrothermal vent metagenome]|uniref:Thioredoxin n=1 Tax=hydrothermal vent metagenome TaxID=652676 RepID=A0A1W1BL73_9ZZZZ
MFKILTTITLLFLFGCDAKTQKDETVKVSPKSTQKESNSSTIEKSLSFTLNTVDGKQLNISEIENGLKFEELKDKAIFIVFFGYRCPPCLREIPILIELTEKHKDLAIIAIEVQGYDNEELTAFGKRKGINYNLISSDGSMNFISYIQAKANWHGSIPFLLGLKRNGQVSIVHTGGVGKSALEGAYHDLINNK